MKNPVSKSCGAIGNDVKVFHASPNKVANPARRVNMPNTTLADHLEIADSDGSTEAGADMERTLCIGFTLSVRAPLVRRPGLIEMPMFVNVAIIRVHLKFSFIPITDEMAILLAEYKEINIKLLLQFCNGKEILQNTMIPPPWKFQETGHSASIYTLGIQGWYIFCLQ